MRVIFNIIGTLMFLGAIGSVITSCSDNEEPKKESAYAVADGGVGYIVKTSFIAFDKASYNEMISYLGQNNNEAIQEMFESDRAILLNKGQEVTVIKFGYRKSFVEIQSYGVRGYVPTDTIKDKFDE